MSGSSVKKRLTGAVLIRMFLLLLGDVVIVNAAGLLSLLLRCEFNIEQMRSTEYFADLLRFAPINTVTAIVIFYLFKLYTSVWSFAGIKEAMRVAAATLFSAGFEFIAFVLLKQPLPRSFFVLDFLFLAALEVMFRLSYRLIRNVRGRMTSKRIPAMIIGAGQTGAMVLRELQNNSHSHSRAVCFIDDNPKLHGRYLNGVRVVGGSGEIKEAVEKYKVGEIILAVPGATAQQRKNILALCQETSCLLRIVPAVYQLANGDVCIQEIRNVEVEDLLGRETVNVNLDEIADFVSGKTVLVTGGGGSIGSELCRQITKYAPKKLIIFDVYENNAYDIQQELLERADCPALEVLIGSVRDERRVDRLFEEYRPDVVYHAAAHKHVPLMEDSPNEAIKNNVFGTLNVARAADKYGAQAMVLISTDKAVNPTNVMGASKRICEMIIQTLSQTSKTRFVAVRFGNVLGSNGSVIPLFKRQIANGGPVTVTHKEIIRYFMTIPEAVSLVLQAGAYAKGGEIFVLDMGKPVKIYDLAVNMIKLSGLRPHEDIPIEITGLRPGEKLYEEMLMSEEGLDKTPNKLIFIGHPNDFDHDFLLDHLSTLRELSADNCVDIRDEIEALVSTYHREPVTDEIPK